MAVMLFSSSVWSQDAVPRTQDATASAPYASIVARNMFGLLPIPPPDPNAGQPPADPPPKITPTGIMTIFGREQALFRVANKPKQGQPAREDAYVLAEGERQDEVEVVKIDSVSRVITFNNHGAVQELPLETAKESGSGLGGGGGRMGFGASAVPMRPGIRGIPPPNMGGNTLGNPNPNVSAGAGGGNSAVPSQFGAEVNANRVYQPAAPDLTPEQNVILMEAQRMQYLQNGNNKMANMIPPTPITHENQ